MKKRYLFIIVGIIILSTSGYFLLSGKSEKGPKYRTDKVSRGPVIVQVRATGTVEPVDTVGLGSQVSGIIAKLYADYNSIVHKDEIVAVIDSTFLYTAVLQAQANVEHNQALTDDAKLTMDRTRELVAKQLDSQADLDLAVATYQSDLASTKQAQAALDQAQVNLRYAVIRSPIDGVVIARFVEAGQTVAATLQTPMIFTIAKDLTLMHVEASIDEADIGQVHVGEKVAFTVDAYPEENFFGTVSQVRLQPIMVQNVVTYTVIIDVPNPEMKLRPGMTATVTVLVDKHDSTLRIPTTALRFNPPQDILDKFRQDISDQQSALQQSGGGSGQMASRDSSKGKHRRIDQQMQEQSQGQGQTPFKTSRVWVLQPDNTIKPVQFIGGLNDNHYLEVVSGDLKEGDDIVLGIFGVETSSSTQQQVNPFAPRFGGPGGGGGQRPAGGGGGGR